MELRHGPGSPTGGAQQGNFENGQPDAHQLRVVRSEALGPVDKATVFQGKKKVFVLIPWDSDRYLEE